MPDGSLVTLRRLKSGSDPEQPGAFSDGRVTFVQEIEGAGGPRVLFARGRMVPAPCTRHDWADSEDPWIQMNPSVLASLDDVSGRRLT